VRKFKLFSSGIWAGERFDVSILEMGDGMFHVKAVNGNTALGGDDWDEMLVDYLAEKFYG